MKKGKDQASFARQKSEGRSVEYVYVGGRRQKLTAGQGQAAYRDRSRQRSSQGSAQGSMHNSAERDRRGPQGSYGSSGVAYGEGRRALAEALDLRVPLAKILVVKSLDYDADLAHLLQRASKRGIALEEVSRERLDRISAHGAHQGVIFEMPPFEYASLTSVIQQSASKKDALVVVCDHITDEGNLGAIIRSAEVVGASCVVIPSRRSARVGIGAYKTSAGACMHLPVVEVTNISAALKELKAAGFWVAGASEHAQVDLWNQPLAGRLVLVMGSEGQGISSLVQKHCDFLVKLPQMGKIESLNVAQAATALAYEWLRQVSVCRKAE